MKGLTARWLGAISKISTGHVDGVPRSPAAGALNAAGYHMYDACCWRL